MAKANQSYHCRHYRRRMFIYVILFLVLFSCFFPLASGAGKGGSTKTFASVVSRFRNEVDGRYEQAEDGGNNGGGDASSLAVADFDDDDDGDDDDVDGDNVDQNDETTDDLLDELTPETTNDQEPHHVVKRRNTDDNAAANGNSDSNNKLLRSGIVQHAVATGGGPSDSSSSSSSSASRDRDNSADSNRKLKMAATHNKNRGSSSSSSAVVQQNANNRANVISNTHSNYGTVSGVDQAKYEMLYNRTSEEMKIKRMLLYSGLYDKTSRPVTQDRDNVTVHIGISLYHILDTNEKYQTISLLIAVRLKWRDAMLRWDPTEFKGVEQIWLPSDLLWTPDIVINNNADHEVKMQTNAIVEYTGDILWMYPQLAKIYCTLDVRNFPFDVQHCDIKFFSWTYNGYQIDLMTTESENPSYFDEANQEWNVVSIRGKRNVAIYACCPEPFPDISFTLIMKRRSMFYIFNLIFPCMLIYAVAFLGFFLPIESNEKINLEVTILLALVVFLMVIGETMPPSPDAIPLLGMLYASTMMMVSIALVSAVAVTNVYYKEKYGEQVPRWLFRLLYWNADLLCPKCKMPQRMLRSAQFDKTTGMAMKKPFKNANFMMAPPLPSHYYAAGGVGVDYSVTGVDAGMIGSPAFGIDPASNMIISSPSANPGATSPTYAKSPAHRRAAWIKASSTHTVSGPGGQASSVVAAGGTMVGIAEQATPEGTTQCTSLNQQVSLCSEEEFNNNAAALQHMQLSSNSPVNNSGGGGKKRSGADSPVWKHRGNGMPGVPPPLPSPTDANCPTVVENPGWNYQDPSAAPMSPPGVANQQQYQQYYQQQQQQPMLMQHQQQQQQQQLLQQQQILNSAIRMPGVRSTPATFVRQLSEGGHSTRFVRTDAGCVHITISWREIAERIDGILFWAFLVSSVVVFTLIFVTVDYEDPVPGK